MTIMKIKEKFKNWKINKGIFDELAKLDVPWSTDSFSLNLDYFGNHSGEKVAAPLLDALAENELTDNDRGILAMIIYDKYINDWNMLYKAVTTDYEPLSNYDKTSTITTETDAHTDTTENKERIDSNVYGEITTTQGQRSDTIGAVTDITENKTSAFNSTTYQDNTQTTDNRSAQTNIQGSQTDTTDSHTDTYNKGKEEIVNDYGKQKNTVNERTQGNIGVTTSQQMLQSEFDLRNNYNFFKAVYKNIDEVLACPMYLTNF